MPHRVGLIRKITGFRSSVCWKQVVTSLVYALPVSSCAEVCGTLPTRLEWHCGARMKIRSLLYWLARLLGDVNAVRKGRVGQRVVRRVAGKAAGRAMRKTLR